MRESLKSVISFHLEEVGQQKGKEIRREINVRVEINELRAKTSLEKITETKNYFLRD